MHSSVIRNNALDKLLDKLNCNNNTKNINNKQQKEQYFLHQQKQYQQRKQQENIYHYQLKEVKFLRFRIQQKQLQQEKEQEQRRRRLQPWQYQFLLPQIQFRSVTTPTTKIKPAIRSATATRKFHLQQQQTPQSS